jgi:hypothetical protein
VTYTEYAVHFLLVALASRKVLANDYSTAAGLLACDTGELRRDLRVTDGSLDSNLALVNDLSRAGEEG